MRWTWLMDIQNQYIKCGLNIFADLDQSWPEKKCEEQRYMNYWTIQAENSIHYVFFKLLINDIFVNVTIAYKVTYQFLTRSIVQNSNSSSGACRCRDNWLRWSRFKYSRSTYVSTLVNNFVYYRQNELLGIYRAKCFWRIKVKNVFSFENITKIITVKIRVKIFTKIHTICKTETNERAIVYVP